jgi:hypothetical protein
MSCRGIIGLYLVNATWIARSLRKNPQIALFQEIEISHPDLPGVGPISGALDYLTSATAKLSVRKYPALATPRIPHFVVIEAKRQATVGEIPAQAQLLAQLLTLNYLNEYIGLCAATNI